jgi:predicted homoserine dehydrogenase-like protein
VPAGTPIQEAINCYQLEEVANGFGTVDYIVGASPSPGVFVVGTHENETQREYLDYYKMSSGPYYCFYTPYHLCHFEIATTIARAVVFGDAAVAPQGGPMVEVVATAKMNLQAGQVLDGIGHYMTYGQAENADIVYTEELLPMGIAEGCRLKRDIARDKVLRYTDVELPSHRLCDQLRAEQNAYFYDKGTASGGNNRLL